MTNPAPMPEEEAERLEALRCYNILDTEPEEAFERITHLAADLFDAPICLVSLVDEYRQWFKSVVGLSVRETHRDLAFCAYAIHGDDILYVKDTHKDERFVTNDLVTGPPYIRTYVGAPLIAPNGYRLGTLCIIYPEVTDISAVELEQLQSLAAIARDAIESRLLTEKAVAADKAKSQFLANMSHEIRTPMVGILGMAELLLTDEMGEAQKSKVRTIQNSADLLLRLLNDILDQAKIEAGELELECVKFNVLELLTQNVEFLEPRATAKGLTLNLSVSPDVAVHIFADPVRVQQILINLVGNAIKFSTCGVISVDVDLDNTQKFIVFSVSDQGVGISKDDQRSVFERFKQSDAHKSLKEPGTGLGLAISYQLAKLMQGTIEVESTPNVGSRFWFKVPYEPTGDATDTNLKATHHQLPDTQLSILCAEDNPVNQIVIEKMLQSVGHQVKVVSNGEEAVKAFETGTFDVILMDVRMPVMDGIQATRAIRSIEEKRPLQGHLPIIAFTADAISSNTQEYLTAGMDQVVPKPVKIDKLLTAIWSVLADRSG